MTAGKDEKYQVIKDVMDSVHTDVTNGYTKFSDAKTFASQSGARPETKNTGLWTVDGLKQLGINKKVDDIAELYTVGVTTVDGKEVTQGLDGYHLINTSGKVMESNGKNKDGNDYYYVIKNKKIIAVYAEN